jgi:hypothetical protein
VPGKFILKMDLVYFLIKKSTMWKYDSDGDIIMDCGDQDDDE